MSLIKNQKAAVFNMQTPMGKGQQLRYAPIMSHPNNFVYMLHFRALFLNSVTAACLT